MHNNDQTVVVRHKEFLGEITGSMEFTVQRFFFLQPGDTNTFPWLSKIAEGFQQYRIKGMVFHYVPSSGYAVSNTSSALGTVMIQTSYRSNDSNPTTKIEMLNEYWSTESVPSEPFCHPIECDPKENPFNIHYVRTSPTPVADSPLMYDLGKTFVATSGMQGANVVGDLWITYEVELKKPLIRSNVTTSQTVAFLDYLSPTTSTLFGTELTASAGSAIQVTAATKTIAFPVGTIGSYLINLVVYAATTFTGQVDLGGTPAVANCALTAFDGVGTTSTRSFVTTGATSISATFQVGIEITDPSLAATITFGTQTWTGTAARTAVTVSTLTY